MKLPEQYVQHWDEKYWARPTLYISQHVSFTVLNTALLNPKRLR